VDVRILVPPTLARGGSYVEPHTLPLHLLVNDRCTASTRTGEK
jgi:hypothetical protein